MGFPDWDALGDTWVILLVQVVVVLESFAGLAIVCDEHMVPALETLCVRWNVREDVAGATFMAFGSAAPEIIINGVSTLKAQAASDKKSTELGLGAIMGSGMIAFLVIPAFCALFARHELELKRRPLFRDILFYALSLVSVATAFRDGKISTLEGGILVMCYLVYIVVVAVGAPVRKYFRHHTHPRRKPLKKARSFVVEQREANEASALLNSRIASARREEVEMAAEPPTALQRLGAFLGTVGAVCVMPLNFLFSITCPPCEEGDRFEAFYAVTFLVSFVWVAFFSYLISSVVEWWGDSSGIPLSFFGVVLVAIGAEIPDTVQSVAVSRRGYGSMAVSNCLGSQITNICIGLGLPWCLSAIAYGAVPIPGHNEVQHIMYFQCGAVLVNAVLLLGHAAVTKSKATLTRSKGVVLLVVYVGILVGMSVMLFGT